jgi:hypothetical protein
VTITAIPASSKIGHGEAAGCFHEHRPVDFWSIGAEGGTIVWIDLQGNGWTGDRSKQTIF